MSPNGLYDFMNVIETKDKNNRKVFTPSFKINSNTKDLMIRGKKFYAIFNYKNNMWETDMNVAMELIDEVTLTYVRNTVSEVLMNDPDYSPIVKRIVDTTNGLSKKFRTFCEVDMEDRWRPLNQKVKFTNSEIKREDYVSYTLDYPLVAGPITYFKKILDKLYSLEEQNKICWMIGAMLCGDQGKIQKFFVFFGDPGTGKSTIIDKIIVETLLGGYESPLNAKFTADALINGKDSFGTDFLATDPIFAYDDDADLSRVNSKTTLNMIVSHERVRINAKFARVVWANPKCFLVCGTNEPVQLSRRSGFIRRLIDIRPTGELLSNDEYDECINQLQFEKSGIAQYCVDTYKRLGKNYYAHYIPEDMLERTDPFHNFVKDYFVQFLDGITLANAYNLYEVYCEEANLKSVMPRHRFRDNLKLYFDSYDDRFFSGFRKDKIGIYDEVVEESEPIQAPTAEEKKTGWLSFDFERSDFDEAFANEPAQYAKEDGTPKNGWNYISTKLADIDTHKLHYVKLPEDVIVIDFDIKDESGEKSFTKNLEAANHFPPTYAELSKSGSGIHLHYIWLGEDVNELSRVYGSNVEIKTFKGNSALRRKLTKCNDYPIAELSCGLPKKGVRKTVVDWDGFKNERILRSMIIKNLNKMYHPNTKPSIDYIDKLLKDAYESGATYDVRDLQQQVLGFALQSTNKADYCVNLVTYMHFCSKDIEEAEKKKEMLPKGENDDEAPIVIYDTESFPEDENGPALFLICWKYYGAGHQVTAMLNPSPEDVERLFKFRLIGFNNLKYDDHLLFARVNGYSIKEINKLSQRIIAKDKTAFFSGAYGLSYADVHDFATNKQGLKKWEIELGISHIEVGLPWDKSAPKERYNDIIEYCKNDVLATEAVFDACKEDWKARLILSDLAGMPPSTSTNRLTLKIVFGDEKYPQLVYTDFATGKQTEGR